MELVIVECPYCGCRRYSWDEQDALDKLATHKCFTTLLDRELDEILTRIIEGGEYV